MLVVSAICGFGWRHLIIVTCSWASVNTVNVFAGFAEGSIRADAQRDGEQTARTVTVRN